MGTNKGKLKKQKRATNSSQENRRKQVMQEVRQQQEQIEDRAKLASPARPNELAALERQYSKRR